MRRKQINQGKESGSKTFLIWNLTYIGDSKYFSGKGQLANIFVFLGHKVSVQFSRSVMSDSLQPHGLQHARPPCPSPTPRVYSNSCPLSQWCHPTISSPSCPTFSLSQHQGLFKWVSSSHQVAKVGQALMLVFPRREARRGKGQRNRPLAEPLALYSLAKGLGCF